MPETVRCSICGQAIKVKNFKDQMDKIRRHRKLHHPKAFRVSIKRGMRTRRENKR